MLMEGILATVFRILHPLFAHLRKSTQITSKRKKTRFRHQEKSKIQEKKASTLKKLKNLDLDHAMDEEKTYFFSFV